MGFYSPVEAGLDYRISPNYKSNADYDIVARNIGGWVTPERVGLVVEGLDQGWYLLHGVKREKYYISVLEHGIMPKTPAGGLTSSWAHGRSVFIDGTGQYFGLNTPFFDYGHSYDSEDSSRSKMTIAVTKVDWIREYHPDFNPSMKSGEICVPYPVGRGDLIIFRIDVSNKRSVVGGNGSTAGQEMFGLLEQLVQGRLTRGTIAEIRR